jgi:hypothetical protein
MKINYEKSQVFATGVEDQESLNITERLNCQMSTTNEISETTSE